MPKPNNTRTGLHGYFVPTAFFISVTAFHEESAAPHTLEFGKRAASRGHTSKNMPPGKT